MEVGRALTCDPWEGEEYSGDDDNVQVGYPVVTHTFFPDIPAQN